jgi:peptide/nickel transport system permease protein
MTLVLKNVSRRTRMRRAFRASPLGALGLVLAAVFLAAALLAPWVARQSPNVIDLTLRLSHPTWAHWFGTDDLGRDIFARVVFGARVSMTVAICVVAISLSLGIVVGSLAGYYGGWTDRILNTLLMNSFLALPGLLLAIAFAAFLGPGLFNLVLALAISGWVGYARLVRAQVLAAREKEYVEAARALGAGSFRILRRHILPNILQPVLVQASLGMAGAVLGEATLSFLGLGVTSPTASWGSMLNDARSHLFDAPHLIVFPAVAVALCILSFNFVADALRDRLDPRTRLTLGL